MVDLGTLFRILDRLGEDQGSNAQSRRTEQSIEYMNFPVEAPDEDSAKEIESFIFMDQGEKYEYIVPKDIEPVGDSMTLWFEPGNDTPTDLYWDGAPDISVTAEALMKLEDGELVPCKSNFQS